jgi:hypothetical protein
MGTGSGLGGQAGLAIMANEPEYRYLKYLEL